MNYTIITYNNNNNNNNNNAIINNNHGWLQILINSEVLYLTA